MKELASSYGMDIDEISQILEDAENQLLRARDDRVRPFRDEKILAGWNGLVISAMAKWSPILGGEYLEDAEKTLEFLKDRLWNGDENVLYRRYKDGDVSIHGFLEDYAYLARGSFDLYQVSGNLDFLEFGKDLIFEIKNKFIDKDTGIIHFSSQENEEVIARTQDLDDQSTPSSVAVALRLLMDIYPLFPKSGFEKLVERSLSRYSSKVETNPLRHASLTLAKNRRFTGPLEITLITDKIPEKWQTELAHNYYPNKVIYPRPLSKDRMEKWLDSLKLDELPPVWNRESVGDASTLYICAEQTCSEPMNDIAEAISWLDTV